MDNLDLYVRKHSQMLEMRERGESKLEDGLLNELDLIWAKLNQSELDKLETLFVPYFANND